MADAASTSPFGRPQYRYHRSEITELIQPIVQPILTAYFAHMMDEDLTPFPEDRERILSHELYEARRLLDALFDHLEEPITIPDERGGSLAYADVLARLLQEDTDYALEHLPKKVPVQQVINLFAGLDEANLTRFLGNLRALAQGYASVEAARRKRMTGEDGDGDRQATKSVQN